MAARCQVNPYCRVHVLGQNFPLSRELMDYLMDKRVGVVQYLCPETSALGLLLTPGEDSSMTTCSSVAIARSF
jgi:hypothetical protein